MVDDGYKDDAKEKLGGHKPAGPLRGGKYSIFEGGTRVPLVVRWLGRVKPGVSDALICQVDFSATFAALTGQMYEAKSFARQPECFARAPRRFALPAAPRSSSTPADLRSGRARGSSYPGARR